MSAFPRSRLSDRFPGRRSARWVAVTAGLALVATFLPHDALAVAAPTNQSTSTTDNLPLERPDEASAAVTARITGKPVLITGRTTETTEFRALPDGRIEATVAGGPVRMRDSDGDWIDVDATLVRQADGTVAPIAHPYGLKLAGAAGPGDHQLVSIGAEGKRSALGWSGQLPAPELDGTIATYRDVKPGVDLVVEATRTGYAQRLLVKNRSAAAQLAQIRMPWSMAGLTAKSDGKGGLAVRAGTTQYDVPAPLMWDATVDQASGEHTRRAPVGLGLAKNALLLTPDAAFLRDPKTVYPVTIDPSQSAGASFDAFVESSYTTDQSAATELKVGTHDGGTTKARSYLRFDNQEWLWDKQIQAATLNLWEHHSYSCTAKEWQAYRTPDVTSAIRWSNQPTWNDRVGTSTQTKGFGSDCGDGWVTIPVTAAFQYTATNKLSKTSIGIRATSETDSYGWKRFASREAAANPPSVTITYQTKTSVDAVATAPDTTCATGATRPYISSLTPQLRAQVSDGLAANVYANFEYQQVGATASTVVTEGPGASGSWLGTYIPDGTFAEGGSYAWRVRGSDGTAPGAWSNWCEFTVDTMSPAAAPTVASTTYPVAEWSGAAGTAGTFNLGASGVSDVAAYEYGVDTNPPDQVVNAASLGASTSVSITPTTDGPHTLWVRTRDRAGNRSPLTSYQFAVGGGAVLTPKPGDVSAAKTAITGVGRTTATGVTYQWRRGDTDTWTNIPAGHVTVAAGGGAVTWPLASTGGGQFPKLNWDMEATLASVDALSIPRDGPLQIRGAFSGGTAANSGGVKLTFDRNLATAASKPIGPGEVNLLTGNVTLSDTDVTVEAYGSDLTVSRTYNSRQAAKTDPSGMFGPGWISGAIVDEAETPYTSLEVFGSLRQIGTPDGDTVGFTARDGVNFDPEVGQETLKLVYTSSTDTYKLTDDRGTAVVFGRVTGSAVGKYFPTTTTLPGSNQTTSYSWEKVTVNGTEVVRPTRVVAPVPDGVNCTTLARGCRALSFTYATATTATGSTLGDYIGRVKQVSFTAWDPDLATPALRTVPMRQYSYDSTGRLRATWDPRIGTSAQETYSYQADGVLASVKPAGQDPWQFSYATTANDPAAGRLQKATRAGATETVVYKVPLTAPYDLSPAQTKRWGQPEAPTDATAVFPADQQPNGSDYQRATVSYLDANGRAVNEAEPGGAISSTWYDSFGNEVRKLTATNRARALNQSPNDNETAEQTLAQNYSTVNTYSLDGMRLETVLAPESDVRLDDGTITKGRGLTRRSYDQGAPTSGGPYNLVTTEDAQVRVWGTGGTTVEADKRSTTTAYNWSLRQPTVVTVDPGGLGQATRTTLDPVTGLQLATTQPSGGTSTNTPATRKTINYRATSGSGYAECDLRPEWANLPCRVQPGGQPASGAELPAQVTTYDIYHQERAETEKTSAGVLRTNTTTYDAAGRVLETSVVGLGATPPVKRNVYDPATGDVLRTQSVVNGTVVSEVVRTYDTLGRLTSYKDADGNLSTTTYDLLGRKATSSDGKGNRTYGYDFRGLLTSVTDNQAGTYTGDYNPDGQLVTETWPNGVKVDTTYDAAGKKSGITYSKPGCAAADCTLFREVLTNSGQGDTTKRVSTLSSEVYTQDKAGRVTKVEEAVGEQCITRVYGFSAATDRNDVKEYAPAADGSCQTTSPASSKSWTYDAASRVTNAGYVYDALGRTTTVPAADTGTPAAGNLTATYQADDLVDTITQGGRTTDYTIDVMGERIQSWSDNATGATVQNVNHYEDDEDSPAWTQEGPDRWTRVVQGLDGMTAVVDSDSAVAEWQVSDLSGDIVATIHAGEEGLSTTNQASEYGVPGDSETVGKQRYGWLGAQQRAADAPAGIVLMGVRLYNPVTGRFLQTDPVYGGSCNAYEYTCADPVNGVDLDGKRGCWTPWCHYKTTKKILKGWYRGANKFKWVRKITQNRYVRSCAGGAFGVLMFDTIKNGLKKLSKKWRRWGIAGCLGGMYAYHAKRRGWW